MLLLGVRRFFLAPATNKASHGVVWHHVRCILVVRCLSVPHSTVSERFSSENQHLPLEMSPNATITGIYSSSCTDAPAMRPSRLTRVAVGATVLGSWVGATYFDRMLTFHQENLFRAFKSFPLPRSWVMLGDVFVGCQTKPPKTKKYQVPPFLSGGVKND